MNHTRALALALPLVPILPLLPLLSACNLIAPELTKTGDGFVSAFFGGDKAKLVELGAFKAADGIDADSYGLMTRVLDHSIGKFISASLEKVHVQKGRAELTYRITGEDSKTRLFLHLARDGGEGPWRVTKYVFQLPADLAKRLDEMQVELEAERAAASATATATATAPRAAD